MMLGPTLAKIGRLRGKVVAMTTWLYWWAGGGEIGIGGLGSPGGWKSAFPFRSGQADHRRENRELGQEHMN